MASRSLGYDRSPAIAAMSAFGQIIAAGPLPRAQSSDLGAAAQERSKENNNHIKSFCTNAAG